MVRKNKKCRVRVREPYEKNFYVENFSDGTIVTVVPKLSKAIEIAKAEAGLNPNKQFGVSRTKKVVECK